MLLRLFKIYLIICLCFFLAATSSNYIQEGRPPEYHVKLTGFILHKNNNINGFDGG